jgi:hypothetical protein
MGRTTLLSLIHTPIAYHRGDIFHYIIKTPNTYMYLLRSLDWIARNSIFGVKSILASVTTTGDEAKID